MSDEQPRWDLLPRDPLAFFELEHPFDRKDLKRKYNRLIKVYKPEKAPEEFKKIRAAYETLEDWLKRDDDVPVIKPAPIVFDDQTFFKQREAAPLKSTGDLGEIQADRQLPLQHVPESMRAVYNSAIEQETKGGADPLKFLEHLLHGMRQLPNDRSLDGLISAFCDLDWDRGTLQQIFSQVLRYVPEHFYHLTLSAWHRYASLVSTDLWQQKLDQVEAQLILNHPAEVSDFYQNLLFYHWSYVEQPWLQKKLELIEDLSNHSTHYQQFHLDLLNYLVDYREVSAGLVQEHPMFAYMHEHIVLFCQDFSEAGARRFQEMHRELLRQGEDYINAFPVEDPRFNVFFRVMNGLSLIALEELGVERISRSKPLRMLVFDTYYRQMARRLRGTGPYLWMCVLMAAVVPMSLLTVFTVMYSFIQPLMETWEPAYKAGLLIAVMFAGYIGIPKIVVPMVRPLLLRLNERFYEQHWRYELMDFIHQEHIPVHELDELLVEKSEQAGMLSPNVVLQMRKDWALWFYSLSIMFV